MDVATWLRGLGLARYENTFRDNGVNAEVLPKLTVDDLRDLGITAVGDRRTLLDAIAALRAGPEERPERKPPAELAQVEGDRRQVTVLFADLAGYSALSNELDAEDVHALLGCFFRCIDCIIENHGGYVDKHIGDCVMAVFGAPVAHGNDAERAVRAAIAIRDAMPELSAEVGRPVHVHAGVAGGRVIASAMGSGAHREYTVTGDTVNLAARVTDAAAPGEILISESVQLVLAGRLDCSEADALAVKGFTEPVHVWRLRGLLEAAPDLRPFVGRHAEMRQFQAILAACRETARGQAVYVRGEPGIGKTRLVEEFRRAAREAGFACHTGSVLDFGTGTGRDAIRALVRSLIGLGIATEAEARRAAAAGAVEGGLVAAENAVFLNDLLDLLQPTELRSLYDAMDQQTRDRGKRATVVELVRRSSMRLPLMLTLEDLHWADATTLAHAAELAAVVAECSAVLVMTSRIEGDQLDYAWRGQTRGTQLVTVDIGPLRKEEALAFASTFVNACERFALACVERSAGHPLFLEQLLRGTEGSSVAELPASIQSVVLARMDALNPTDKQALQSASVLGQRFSLGALRQIMGDLRYTCADLLQHHLVRPQGEELLFAHALIQQVVYSSLLTSRRRELHRRAADWFADRDLVLCAEHLDRASDPEAPQAYMAAARAQAVAYRNERALQLADRGLALARDRADIHALICLRGELCHDLGAIPEAITAYEQALTVASDDFERCAAWIGLAAGMRILDRYEEAFATLEKAEAAAKLHGFDAELARIHHLRGNLHFPLGDLDSCLREHSQAATYARHVGSQELEARALGGLGDAEYARGRMITAYRHFRRCVELARALGLGRVEVANLTMLVPTRMYFDPLEDVLGGGTAAIEAAKRVGHQRAELIARSVQATCLLEIGEAALAREQIEPMQNLIRHLGARRFDAPALLYSAKVLLQGRRREEAAQLLREALAISRETGVGYMGGTILGALALATDNADERRCALADGESALRAGAVSHNHLYFYRDGTEVALNSSDWNGVAHYTWALEDYTRPEPLPWADFFIARGRALAEFGQGRHDTPLMSELSRLHDQGERLCLKPALQALKVVLAASRGG
jgi:class 3 adenylate cyclase/tetratricopeptide (TPR) repeat protein